MQTGWRLERTFLAGAGFRESRLEGLEINWSDPLEPTGHAALWADNGTGKTTITALRFALYLPDTRDFIRGGSDRSLAKLVNGGDVCHVVEQATRVVGGEQQRIVVGFVAQWRDGVQDLDNPSRLLRFYYGWVTDERGLSIDNLPFRTEAGRWTTRSQFVEAVRAMLPRGGVLPPHEPSERHREWRRWLSTGGIDLEQIHFQTVMNASEGGVDRVMRFHDSDDFVRWLIGAITPDSTVDQIAKSIDVLRANAAARPRWADELDLWERLTDPLLSLAVAYEEVTGHRQAVATAEANASAIVADADVTAAALTLEQELAAERRAHHDQRRKDATATLRRAQAHRLRMQLRAAQIKAEKAWTRAGALERERNKAAAALAAWRLVPTVLEFRTTSSNVAGLTERLNAAEQETAELRRLEGRHRRDLARLLTDRRDRATTDRTESEGRQRRAKEAIEQLDSDLREAVAEHARATERVRQTEGDATAAERVIDDATSAGLIDEGADPDEVDRALDAQAKAARAARKRAEDDLRSLRASARTEQQAESDARRRAGIALNDANGVDRQLREVTRRIVGLTQDDRLVEILGDTATIDLWAQRTPLTDLIRTGISAADAAAEAARRDVAAAQRVLDSVGSDGLFPSSAIVEEAARRCQEIAEIPAWPGWRWLADTMNPEVAAAFAESRPEIASGVVISHPDLVDPAITAIGELDLDVALWVGAVTNFDMALIGHGGAGTQAHVLLPHPGIYDRQAAQDMLDAARTSFSEAGERLAAATRTATDLRDLQADLSSLWKDLPDDPRPELTQRLQAAKARRQAAEEEQDQAAARLAELIRLQEGREADLTTAQQEVETCGERRRLLAPVIAAATTLQQARQRLPGLRSAVTDSRLRRDELIKRRPELVAEETTAATAVREAKRQVDDAAERLRESALTATTEGPVPTDDEPTIRARLNSVQDTIKGAAVDPALHDELRLGQKKIADLGAKLDADRQRRQLAEQLADTDTARHPVAVQSAIEEAAQAEATAREAFAEAKAAADQAAAEHRRRDENTADRSSPDVDGFPSAVTVVEATDADRYAEQLDELAAELLATQRAEERMATSEEQKSQTAIQSRRLVEASINPLRHLSDKTITGQRWSDIDQLTTRITGVVEKLRKSGEKLSGARAAQQSAAGRVREHANGPRARKVEDANDPRVLDLLTRLRTDERLAAEAERLALQLEERAATLRDDLDSHDKKVRTSATMLQIQAATAIDRLRAYQNQSRLPDGLGDWSQRQFVMIEHDRLPDDESVAVDRVARVVHSLLTPQAGRSDAQSLLFAAARALTESPFRVRILKPHTDLSLDRVDVAELKNFSGGQRVTAGVLLYATMTRVRATGDTTSIGWLWLDNPFGQASADQFVRTMRRAADQLGLQLLFTAAPKDKGALSMFDRTIMLARRSRPSSKEKVVVIDDGSKEIVDLMLVQHDVAAVLGQ
jgi:hypothetical protein